MPKPLWLERMNAKQRAVILAKAHAILLDTDIGNTKIQSQTANILWMVKSKYEGDSGTS